MKIIVECSENFLIILSEASMIKTLSHAVNFSCTFSGMSSGLYSDEKKKLLKEFLSLILGSRIIFHNHPD